MASAVKQESIVVFVCEHGAAKSIVAAAHFNQLAAEQCLKVRAIARGTNPDDEISPAARNGLRQDGLDASEPSPQKLSRVDLALAIRVVSFGELPETCSRTAVLEQWNAVPNVSDDYAKARDAIVAQVRLLLDNLKVQFCDRSVR